jgi:ABC-type nitrate/sulfonate/bicarbonate transport system substrate-binding protein
LTTLTIAGVPEHFNLPWQLALENNVFKEAGVDLQWQFNKAGTGAMVKALRDNTIDMSIVLTEGIVAAIINGLKAKIVKPYITTPLIWGIHTGINSGVKNVLECNTCRIAISRFGSGSHLMPKIDAELNNRSIEKSAFIEVSDIEGALKSLNNSESELFYWEKFTTKTYVDQGLIRRVGEFTTPWPCFLIAASEKAIAEKKEAIGTVLDIITKVSRTYAGSPDAVQMLIDRYAMKPEDATAWFYSTDWSYDHTISAKMLQNVMHALKKVEVINETVNPDFLCSGNLSLN